MTRATSRTLGATRRPASASDAIDGVTPAEVLTPASVAELAALLAGDAAPESLVVRGAGTKLDFGAPPERLDAVLDLSALASAVEHYPDDLVVRAGSSVRLGALQEQLGAHRQRLALDEVVAGSTLGGIVATGLSGPLRHHYGSVRDLLIGISFVRADGTVAKSGGRVVKNVAGYDLCKLLTGSYGTLGVITETVFRLHPLPDQRRFVRATPASRAIAARLGAELAASPHEPAAVEIQCSDAGAIELVVLVEGPERSCTRRAEAIARAIDADAIVDDLPGWWGELPGATTIKVAVPPAAAGEVLTPLEDLGRAQPLVVRGSLAIGLLGIGLSPDADPEALARVLGPLRALAQHLGGSATVLRAPATLKTGIDVFGPVAGAGLMTRVKDSFDPAHRLAPGRFVAGI